MSSIALPNIVDCMSSIHRNFIAYPSIRNECILDVGDLLIIDSFGVRRSKRFVLDYTGGRHSRRPIVALTGIVRKCGEEFRLECPLSMIGEIRRYRERLYQLVQTDATWINSPSTFEYEELLSERVTNEDGRQCVRYMQTIKMCTTYIRIPMNLNDVVGNMAKILIYTRIVDDRGKKGFQEQCVGIYSTTVTFQELLGAEPISEESDPDDRSCEPAPTPTIEQKESMDNEPYHLQWVL